MNILIVLTSHNQLGDTGKKTGYWLEELAAPFMVFTDAGAAVTLASPKGGQPPVDPKSDTPETATDLTRRFKADLAAQNALSDTIPLSRIRVEEYDAVFYPGGHGPLWDLAEDADSIALLEKAVSQSISIGTVCHGPAALRHVKDGSGAPLVRGRSVTGFSNSEEEAGGTASVVPFAVETMLVEQGGKYSKAGNGQVHVVRDGLLVTGQNPASSEQAARMLLAVLRENA